jgi:hypothetical protein
MGYGSSFPYHSPYVIQDPKKQRASTAHIMLIDEKHVPSSFNMVMWQNQATRYLRYWQWFSGEILATERAASSGKEPILKYPLGINSVRNFARKHASILLGEETYESAMPLVKTIITPKIPLDGGEEFTDEEVKFANLAQGIVNTVWAESNGRSLQMENAILSQFLGGSVYQLTWQPWRKDELTIPIVIKSIVPDYFLPIWQSDDYWNLLEAFVVYRIPGALADRQYGMTNFNDVPWVIYCEHWTADHYSIYLNGEPLRSDFSGEMITYKEVKNPFGFVPFIYTPHLREGSFWGHSHVEDIEGLLKELNARSADMGDSVRNTVHRDLVMTDVKSGHPKHKKISEGRMAIDLGATNPATKVTPKVTPIDPPSMSPAASEFIDWSWKQLMREGHISNIAFGEDEGSQRSALTLAFRMWPSTAHSRMERTFWTDGLNHIAKMILKMVQIKMKFINSPTKIIGMDIPKDFIRKLNFAQEWKPQIPRDREQMVNEIILRFQAGLVSLERALEMFGDVDYIDDEIVKIKEWLTFRSTLESKSQDMQSADEAITETTTPVAESGIVNE